MILRRLPPSEWDRLSVAYEECRADKPLPLPKPEQSIILAAEHEGRLIGAGGIERTWHISPFWIDKKFRGTGLANQMAQELAKFNTERLAEVLVTTNHHVDLLVSEMGFDLIPQSNLWRRTP